MGLSSPVRRHAGKLLRLVRRTAMVPVRQASRAVRTFRWLTAVARETATRRREARLTIAVDISPLWESLTGVGWYLERLLGSLADHPDLCLRLYGPTSVWSDDLPPPVAPLPRGTAVDVVHRFVPAGLLLPQGLVIRLLRRLEPLLLALDGNRVLFAPNYFLPRRFRLCRGELVAMIHDLASIHVPWTLRDETLRELRQNLESTAFQARLLLTPTEAVRREVVAAGLADIDRVRAIHHGPGQLPAAAPYPAPAADAREPFVLTVGTLEPRKDFETLLVAWEDIEQRVPDVKLVVCGRPGWKSEELAQRLRHAAARGRVVHRGYVDTVELARLYQRTAVVAFPSLYEGFGLPALEAMSSGAALIASDLPVLREVAGDGALYAPAGDTGAWAASLERLLTDRKLRESLASAGRRRAAEFRWDRAASQTADAFSAAAGSRWVRADRR